MAKGWLMHDGDWLNTDPTVRMIDSLSTTGLKDGKTVNVFDNDNDNSFGLEALLNSDPSIAWQSANIGLRRATLMLQFTKDVGATAVLGNTLCLFGLAVVGRRRSMGLRAAPIRYTIPREPVVRVTPYKTNALPLFTDEDGNEQSFDLTMRPLFYRYKRGSQQYPVQFWRADAVFPAPLVVLDGTSFRLKIEVTVQDGSTAEADQWVLRIGRVMMGTRLTPAVNFSRGWETRWGEATDPSPLPGTFGEQRRRLPYRRIALTYRKAEHTQRTDLERFYETVGSTEPVAVLPDPDDPEGLMYARIPTGGLVINRRAQRGLRDTESYYRMTMEEAVVREPELET